MWYARKGVWNIDEFYKGMGIKTRSSVQNSKCSIFTNFSVVLWQKIKKYPWQRGYFLIFYGGAWEGALCEEVGDCSGDRGNFDGVCPQAAKTAWESGGWELSMHKRISLARDQTGQRLDGVQRTSSEWKNVTEVCCGHFRKRECAEFRKPVFISGKTWYARMSVWTNYSSVRQAFLSWPMSMRKVHYRT